MGGYEEAANRVNLAQRTFLGGVGAPEIINRFKTQFFRANVQFCLLFRIW